MSQLISIILLIFFMRRPTEAFSLLMLMYILFFQGTLLHTKWNPCQNNSRHIQTVHIYQNSLSERPRRARAYCCQPHNWVCQSLVVLCPVSCCPVWASARQCLPVVGIALASIQALAADTEHFYSINLSWCLGSAGIGASDQVIWQQCSDHGRVLLKQCQPQEGIALSVLAPMPIPMGLCLHCSSGRMLYHNAD